VHPNKMSIIKSYSISKVNLQVECEDKLLSKKVIDALDDYFFMTSDGFIPNSNNITMRFKNNNNLSFKAPETAQELFASSSLRVLKNENIYYLLSESSVFQLELSKSLGIGLLDSTYWERCPKSKQEFLMLSLLWLLREHGLYGLHANGLVKDGFGILIAGGSGSGKSTTALSLIKQGWDYLSDDVTLFRHSSNGIETIAFQKGFSFDPHLADRYPELNKPLKASSFNGQKRFLDINSIYPNRFLSSCFPKVLIFPKIVSQNKSHLIPIDRSKALILLIDNSGGIMVDKKKVVKQIEVLKQLVYQTDSYQLLAGRDLYEEPEKICEIVSRIQEGRIHELGEASFCPVRDIRK